MKLGDKKQVLISFHYRPWELYNNDNSFASSEYLSGVNEFLNSREIKNLAKELKVVFIPHARYKKYISWFEVPSYISVQSEEQFQDVFVQSDFLITDFSSTSFEFAYMDKPTFVFIPDLDCVKNNMPQYHIENIKNYPHLIWCDTIKDAVNGIRGYCRKSESEFKVSNKMFDHHDTNNTSRMLDWMFQQYGI